MKEKVSIITITLNRESLKRACESIEKQTFSDWHHYILGDGVLPTVYDHAQRSILGFSKVMGITEPGANMPNGTPNPMQRWALKHLDLGEYVCFLDDDNCYTPDYLEKMFRALDGNPQVGLVLCGAKDLRYGQNIDGYPENGRCDNSAVMYRREVVKNIEFPYASMDKNVVQDVEYIMMCSEKYSFTTIDERLLIFGEGLNPPPDRGKYYFLESWKIPQEAYYKALKGYYLEAYDVFVNEIKEHKNDAWSLWKCFELSAILGKYDLAKEYGKRWDSIYNPQNNIHQALFFAHATYLRFINSPDYAEFANTAIELLALEDESAEKHFALARNYRLIDDLENYKTEITKAMAINSSSTYWAYQLSYWESIVFDALFPHSLFEKVKKLEL